MKLIQRLFYHYNLHFNVIKTIYFNFKVFDIKQAIKFPIFLYGNIQIEGLHKGCIVLDKVQCGTVKIGGGWHTEMFGYSNRLVSYVRIEGKLLLGNHIIIQQGALLSISKNAVVRIGNFVRLNERVTLHSKIGITIEDECRVGWNTQIIDTSFHYMVNNGIIKYRDAPIFIGHNVWLANNVNIMKGAVLPAYTVVASNSLINKDFSKIGNNCLLGGIPAKLLANNVERLLLVDEEIDKLFNNYTDILYWDDVKDELSKSIYQNR